MDKSYIPVNDLADYIIIKSNHLKKPILSLQLQHTLYLLQIINLYSTNELLFSEEFEAGPYGAIISDVYYDKYMSYGTELIVDKSELLPDLHISHELQKFIDNGINLCLTMHPWDFSKNEKVPEGPWAQIYNNGKGYRKTIPNKMLFDYVKRCKQDDFKKMIKKY